MLYLKNKSICVLISKSSHYLESLDFILAASNLTEDITVIFIENGRQIAQKFIKPLSGFGINNIFSDVKLPIFRIKVDKIIKCISIQKLSSKDITNYVTHCQFLFCF